MGEANAENSQIRFQGKGNILVCEEDVRLVNSTISFCGDNALLYLSKNSKHPYKLKIDAWRDTVSFFGKDNYFNNVFSAIVSERCQLIVGGDGVFSFGIWARTADPHILYDMHSRTRTNFSKSVYIGDHVWLGQGALLLKGSVVGSGSVVAAHTVVSSKTVPSNVVVAGNPGNIIREKVCFSGASVHNYTGGQSEASRIIGEEELVKYSFAEGANTIDRARLEKNFALVHNAEARLEILQEVVVKNKAHERFAINTEKKGFWRARK